MFNVLTRKANELTPISLKTLDAAIYPDILADSLAHLRILDVIIA